jgi:hypothetical protein
LDSQRDLLWQRAERREVLLTFNATPLSESASALGQSHSLCMAPRPARERRCRVSSSQPPITISAQGMLSFIDHHFASLPHLPMAVVHDLGVLLILCVPPKASFSHCAQVSLIRINVAVVFLFPQCPLSSDRFRIYLRKGTQPISLLLY